MDQAPRLAHDPSGGVRPQRLSSSSKVGVTVWGTGGLPHVPHPGRGRVDRDERTGPRRPPPLAGRDRREGARGWGRDARVAKRLAPATIDALASFVSLAE